MKYAKFKSYLDEFEKELIKSNRSKMNRASGAVKREMLKDLEANAGKWGEREIARRRSRQTGTKQIVQGPPGTFTGNLKKGIDRYVNKTGTGAYVGAMAPAYHMHLLEFGTKNMPAYPLIAPAFERKESQIKQILSEPML